MARWLPFISYWLLVASKDHISAGVFGPAENSLRYRRRQVERRKRIHHGWRACRWNNDIHDPKLGCRQLNRHPRNRTNNEIDTIKILDVHQLPTTALTVLLDNNEISGIENRVGRASDRMYNYMYRGKIPDISTVGNAYYTLLYEYDIGPFVPGPSTYIASEYASHLQLENAKPHNQTVDHTWRQHVTKDISGSRGVTAFSNDSNFHETFAETITRRTLRISGINYRATVRLNGQPLDELHYSNYEASNLIKSSIDGMFRRRYYDISSSHESKVDDIVADDQGNRNRTKWANSDTIGVVISPPDYVGTPLPHHQGGTHDLAKNPGPVSQYLLGWDWCQAMPDRATGFVGSVVVHSTGPLALLDPAIQTLSLKNCSSVSQVDTTDSNTKVDQGTRCEAIRLQIQVLVECVDVDLHGDDHSHGQICSTPGNPSVIEVVVTSDWGEQWRISDVELTGKVTDLSMAVSVKFPENVRLWWPHGTTYSVDNDGSNTIQLADLHNFTFAVYYDHPRATGASAVLQKSGKTRPTAHDLLYQQDLPRTKILSDSQTIRVGIRTVDSYLDEALQGQVFRVNGRRVYLAGGNWITTDQANRYSASRRRYCQELQLHQEAGINLIRVWGGGVAEQDDFYECASELGLLVMQEFWMTGDNNGRWAGNWSWPHFDGGDDNGGADHVHVSYLANVHDTILRLRRHASLLFYCGCNECLAPRSYIFGSPPLDIDSGIRKILAKYDDPKRFYVSSSMGGPNRADSFPDDPVLWKNRSFSLAYADGPYGFELPVTYFHRNPGLDFKVNDTISIGFQPEVGGASAPTYAGLLRFTRTPVLANSGVPYRYAKEDSVGALWQYHKFSPWTSLNGTYDHVYAYFNRDVRIVNASEWCAAAQLAAHVQYQNLFGGFISHMFEYTTSVILWKSQSPWPSLRGFLYDYFLESTGTFRGVQSSLTNSLAVILDPTTFRLRLINRFAEDLVGENQMDVRTEGYGQAPADFGARYTWIHLDGKILSIGQYWTKSSVIPAMSATLLDGNLYWPEDCSKVCLLRLEPIASKFHNSTINSFEVPSDYVHYRAPTWSWLTDPRLGHQSDYSALGESREKQSARASFMIKGCRISMSSLGFPALKAELEIAVFPSSPEVLFYPTFSMYIGYGTTEASLGQALLPLFDTKGSNVVLLPGQRESRILSSSSTAIDNDINKETNGGLETTVILSSWNGPSIRQYAFCTYDYHNSADLVPDPTIA